MNKGMEDFPKSRRKCFSQAKLYLGNIYSSLNLSANFSLQLKLWDTVNVL